MNPKIKATLWVLSLLTILYISNQYREIQRLHISQQIQRVAEPKPSFHITSVNGQTMRVNDLTGETHYWALDGGGWVKINDTDLVTAISNEERDARKRIIQAWYAAIDPTKKQSTSYSEWEALLIDKPSSELQQSFETWRRQQAEEKQRADEERKPLIQAWYKQLTPQEQAATPYEQYETNLLAVTDLTARQKVIHLWYNLTDDTYKQKVPFERFEAFAIRQPLANLQLALAEQLALAKQQKAASTHGVETRIPSSN